MVIQALTLTHVSTMFTLFENNLGLEYRALDSRH
jgi:hypothetical protein